MCSTRDCIQPGRARQPTVVLDHQAWPVIPAASVPSPVGHGMPSLRPPGAGRCRVSAPSAIIPPNAVSRQAPSPTPMAWVRMSSHPMSEHPYVRQRQGPYHHKTKPWPALNYASRRWEHDAWLTVCGRSFLKQDVLTSNGEPENDRCPVCWPTREVGPPLPSLRFPDSDTWHRTDAIRTNKVFGKDSWTTNCGKAIARERAVLTHNSPAPATRCRICWPQVESAL